MKLKFKLLLDFIMIGILYLVFQYNFTGNFIHELIGFMLLAFFIVHIILNKNYFLNLKRRLKSPNQKLKNWTGFILNILLCCCFILMLFSSLFISKDITPFFNVGHYRLWRTLHIVCAYSMIVIVLAHAILHWSFIHGIIKKRLPRLAQSTGWTITTRVLAVILAAAILKSSVQNVIIGAGEYLITPETATYRKHSNQDEQNNDDFTDRKQFKKHSQDDSSSIENAPDTSNNSDDVNNHLSSLQCDGCGKRCSLLTPQCHIGMQQQEQAIEQYNSQN